MIPISDDILKLYGFKLTDDSFDGGQDAFERDGFIIYHVYGEEYVHGAGPTKQSFTTIEELQELWKSKMGTELIMVVWLFHSTPKFF